MENNLYELADIRDVQINLNNTLVERRKSYLKQIKNPYCFKYKKIIVTVEYKGQSTLEDLIISQFT